MALLRCLYALTIFLSAFLLFVVEPMAAKQLLPTLGGSSAVWTTCLVFFSAGAPARLPLCALDPVAARPGETGRAPRRVVDGGAADAGHSHPAQSHGGELSSCADRFPGAGDGDRLTLSCALCHHPLLTAWYAGSFEGSSPYRLFALSNFASLLALVSYPLWIEPRLTMKQQTGVVEWRASCSSPCSAEPSPGRAAGE